MAAAQGKTKVAKGKGKAAKSKAAKGKAAKGKHAVEASLVEPIPAGVKVFELGGDSRRFGYVRVSDEQNIDAQLVVLRVANVGRAFADVSGAKASRPAFDALRGRLRRGDTVVVTKLDRLGRSTVDLLTTLHRWCEDGVAFVAVQQGIDTSTATGRMVCALLAAVAEVEQELIRERAGLALASRRARGITGGRPSKVTPAALARAVRLIDGGSTLADAAAAIGVSRSTLAAHRAAAARTPVGDAG